MSRRVPRVSELLQQEISRIVSEELRDPRLRPLLTVTRVDISVDLQHASVAVSVLGTPLEQRVALEGIESASGFLRRQLGQRLHLKHVPELRFILDTSMADAQRMLSVMDQLRTKQAGDHD